MKKKTWGAVALSAVLALGTAVPAFGLTASTGSDGSVKLDGTSNANVGETEVNVIAEVTQIDATLPVSVTVVANMQGGQLQATPTGDLSGQGTAGYRIENNTLLPLQLIDVKATAGANTKWTYENSPITDINNYGSGDALGRINLRIDKSTDDLATVTSSGTIISAAQATSLGWSIPAATSTSDPGKLGLKLGGTTSYINSSEEVTTADGSAVKLIYTIAIDQQS